MLNLGAFREAKAQMVKHAYGVGVWKFIWNGQGDFISNFRYMVARGSRIRFWRDIWCGDVA